MYRLLVVAPFALLPFVGPNAAADFDQLASKAPATANAIVVVNVGKIHNSEIGSREGLRSKHAKEFAAGLTAIPPNTERLIAASQLDFEFFRPLWEVVLVDLSDPVDAAAAAQLNEGKLDTLSGLPAVALPGDAYLVAFSDQTVGAMSPGSRQTVARWVSAAKSNRSPTISPYLLEAVSYAKTVGTEIVLALDLADVVHPDRVAMRLKESRALAGKDVDLDVLARKLASVRGVMLGIRVTNRLYGAIKVDFGENVETLGGLASPLLLETLADNGLLIDDFAEWKPTIRGSQIMIGGEMSPAGVRHALSLTDTSFLRSDAAAQFEKQADDSSQQNEEYAMAQSTHLYFQSTSKLIGDFKNKKWQTLGQYATFMERYAEKIDRLPMLNVDEEMLDYGAFVSGQLWAAASALRGSRTRSRVRQTSAVAGGVSSSFAYGGRYGRYGWGGGATWWRPYGLSEQQSVRTQIQVQERGRATTTARAAMQSIDQATVQIRRNMTQKYKIEF
jgi:hypothetical protein